MELLPQNPQCDRTNEKFFRKLNRPTTKVLPIYQSQLSDINLLNFSNKLRITFIYTHLTSHFYWLRPQIMH
jgi:hypothetical protein